MSDVQACRQGVEVVGVEVPVAPGRGFCAAVPELGLDGLDWCTLGDQERGAGVAEDMDPDRVHAGSPQRRSPDVAHEVVVAEWLATR